MTSFPFRASATGSGQFALAFDVAEVAPGTAGLNERGWEYCHLEFQAAGVPVQWGGNYVETTRSDEPLTWLAPADSVQALGIGAVLADREDWRVSWAYSTYRRESLPFDAVWLPPDGGHSLGSWDINDDTACRSISMEGDETVIVMSQDCEGHPSIDGATPSILEGWFRGGGETYPFPLSSHRDGAVISIYPRTRDSLTEERVALIAASLVPWRNLWYEPPGLPAGADIDLDTAVSNTLGRRWVERGRFPLGDGWIVVATRIKAIGDEEAPAPAYARVSEFIFERISSGHWVSRDGGGSAGSDLCLEASGSGGPSGGYVLIFTAEPSWTIQVRRDGIWENLAASDGFYAAAYGAAGEQVLALPLRALDEHGLVVRCSTEGAFLEAGEAWSPYRPTESVRDLPVSVSPATGLEPNATVTVSGSGFYRNTGVLINVCPASSVIWDDWSDCIAVPDGIGTIRTDREGRFSTQVRVPVTFSTWRGETIDCRIDECVIRVDANTGLHQYGWAPVSFD